MNVQELSVDELCETIRGLPEEQLDQVLRLLYELKQGKEPEESPAAEAVAPLYRIQSSAVRTGIPDLAHHHDQYLYGLDKRDA